MGTPPPSSGHLSPDGMWRWDGQQWVPNSPYPRTTASSRWSNSWIWWLAAVSAVAVVLVSVGAAAAVYSWAHRPVAATYHPNVIYTRWVPDANVNSGPEPGFKPAFTGLTGADISQARAHLDSSRTVWVIDIAFTRNGSQLLSSLTHDNVASCPGDPNTQASADCPQRHLTIWLDLTQTDIDNWDDGAYVAKVSGPYDLKCLARQAPQAVCAKFVTDPITLQEIDGGEAEINRAFDERGAEALASAINSRAR